MDTNDMKENRGHIIDLRSFSKEQNLALQKDGKTGKGKELCSIRKLSRRRRTPRAEAAQPSTCSIPELDL